MSVPLPHDGPQRRTACPGTRGIRRYGYNVAKWAESKLINIRLQNVRKCQNPVAPLRDETWFFTVFSEPLLRGSQTSGLLPRPCLPGMATPEARSARSARPFPLQATSSPARLQIFYRDFPFFSTHLVFPFPRDQRGISRLERPGLKRVHVEVHLTGLVSQANNDAIIRPGSGPARNSQPLCRMRAGSGHSPSLGAAILGRHHLEERHDDESCQ